MAGCQKSQHIKAGCIRQKVNLRYARS